MFSSASFLQTSRSHRPRASEEHDRGRAYRYQQSHCRRQWSHRLAVHSISRNVNTLFRNTIAATPVSPAPLPRILNDRVVQRLDGVNGKQDNQFAGFNEPPNAPEPASVRSTTFTSGMRTQVLLPRSQSRTRRWSVLACTSNAYISVQHPHNTPRYVISIRFREADSAGKCIDRLRANPLPR
ncbi:hypothetical protein B0H12DRAFT_1237176 [Mycena haematopus]|nr:hypothetical protein B0H12DRAFT_1237176 [Mycena haematopus]